MQHYQIPHFCMVNLGKSIPLSMHVPEETVSFLKATTAVGAQQSFEFTFHASPEASNTRCDWLHYLIETGPVHSRLANTEILLLQCILCAVSKDCILSQGNC
jgi:hypothetical protein